MNRNVIFSVALALVLLGNQLLAQPVSILGPGLNSGRTVFHQSGSRTLYNDTTYILTGLYFVDSTFSLTIEPGTIIKGDTASTLIIYRGATINAQGSVNAPIIFTSNKPAGSRSPGDWAGVIILGAAPTNQASPVIEGGIIPGSYGGTNPNDNSGTLSYVRIEYAGYRFQLNNETNGLTMGGVGRGTQINHIQVSYANDDSYEFFGGTVDAKYLVAIGGVDDEIDTDFGYQGRLQFVFGMKNPSTWDPTGETNGFESDNEGSASVKTPRTFAHISNATLIGQKRVDTVASIAGNKFQYGMVLRRGTQFSIYNSIVMGWPGGFSLRDPQTLASAQGDTMKLRAISMAAWDGVTFLVAHGSSSVTPAQASDVFNATYRNNNGGTAARNPSAIGLVNMHDLFNPDPRPTPGSEPTTAGVWFDTLNIVHSNYFTVTSYRGAFDPSLPLNQQWTYGWTNFDPQNLSYATITTSHNANQWNLRSVPVVPTTYASSVVFPGTLGNPFSFKTGSYTSATTSENGDGYWLIYPSGGNNSILGSTISTTSTTVTVPASGRWVMIGSVSTSKPVGNVTVSGAATILGGLFGWNGSAYSAASTVEPGQAYWVFLQAVGSGGSATITVNP